MKTLLKWVLAAVLLLPLAASALDDTDSRTILSGATTNATSTTLDVSRYASTGLDITITNTATVTINVRPSVSGTFRAHSCINAGTGASASAFTASANVQCNTAGMAELQAVISGCSSCTVTVRARVTTAKLGSGSGGGATVQEGDGNPTVANVRTIIVTNGSLTDNGNGSVTVATSGAANVTINSSTITGGTNGGVLYADGGPVLQQLTGAGLLLVNSGSAPTIYGGIACTNQVVEDVSAAGVGTCRTITSAYVDSSILVSGGALGTPSSATLTNATGLPVSTGISGLAANIATFLGTPTSANLIAAVTNETGTGALVFGTAPTIDSPVFTTKTFIPRVTAFPGSPSAGDTVLVTDDSTTGACDSAAGSSRTLCQYTGSAWVSIGDGGAGGSIGGSTGGTNNAVLVANGTGGSTLQASTCTIAAGIISCSGFISTAATTGTLTMLEGSAPGAGTNAGEHNVYFDSSDSKLKSHENGGAVVVYVRTADNLSVMAATTSAELAGVISNETGSGALVFGTSPTIATPTFSGSPTLADGATWTFNPNGTASGINVGAHTADPSVPNNGDIVYRSDTNKFRCRENGAWVDCISTGAGTGDVTDVTAGAGIAVTNPGGPAPAVAWDASTFTANIVFWSGASATRTLTASLSGATDPVITFGDNQIDVTTGILLVGGSLVATTDNTASFTNKTLDCAAGTGNDCTMFRKIWLPAAGVNGATAASIWDLPASNPAVAAAVNGSNTIKGVLDFADSADLSAQVTLHLSSLWTGAVDAKIKWLTTATSGDVVWQIQTICVADGETDDPAFNAATTITDTAKGTTNQTNDASTTNITMTGCAAGELLHVKIRRDAAHVSDTLAATARFIGLELTMRETH